MITIRKNDNGEWEWERVNENSEIQIVGPFDTVEECKADIKEHGFEKEKVDIVGVAGIDYIVTLEELVQLDINSALEKIRDVDCSSIDSHLDRLIEQNLVETSDSLDLLRVLIRFTLVLNNPDNPFKPEFVGPDGRRTLVPSDFGREQIDIIAEFAPKVKNPGLRARLADVSWFIRRHTIMAEIAIGAYCESVEKVRKGEAVFSDESSLDDSFIDGSFIDNSATEESARDIMARAAQISSATKWKLKASKRFKVLLKSLLEDADKREDGWGFFLMGTISLEYENKILPIERLAEIAKRFTEKPDIHPDTQNDLFCLLIKVCKEPDKKKYVIASAKCFERKADCAGSEMEAERYLENAILLLKRYRRDTERERRNLTYRLQKTRESIIKNKVKRFRVESPDFGWMIEESVNSIRNLPWPDAFNSLIQCDYALPNPDEFCKMAFECAQETPLQALIPYVKIDRHGRVMFRAEEEDEHLHYLNERFRDIYRQVIVQGAINPKREIIDSEYQFSNETIAELLQDKPFVADDHKDIYTRAIFHFLNGNNIEAASLLVPQLENSLKRILTLEGRDTTEIHDIDDQPEASLHILLDPRKEWRRKLEKILSIKYVLEIDFLFDFPGGPSIRKEIAHGMMSDQEFQDHNCVYAVWLIIHLAIVFPEQLSE